jgi:His/Glu/Gln/Arg/opine family amino acid ABC transporter permease subunit
MGGYVFYWSIVWDAMPDLLFGAWVTLQVAVLSIVFGTLLGMPMAVARQKGAGANYRLATAWVEIARNTPVLFQVYMMYFGLGALGVNISSYASVLIALTFNNAGYLAEIFRGGLAAVPVQQLSAARSLGMTRLQGFLHVVFPQVFRIVFFSFVTQCVWAMLNTSLGMLVGLRELSGAAQAAQSVTFRTFEFFIVTAAIYYVMAKMIEITAQIVFARVLRT